MRDLSLQNVQWMESAAMKLCTVFDLVLKVMTSQSITLAKSFDSESVPNFRISEC